jgi:hypothetical protein
MEKKKRKKSKEKVCEVFEVGDKEVKACGEIEEKEVSKKELKNEKKILFYALILMGILLISFAGTYYYLNSSKAFEYRGIKFDIIKEKKITFYHTVVPIFNKGVLLSNYNIYLRKDPRKTGENVLFEGKAFRSELMALNNTVNISCNGDGVVAIANMKQIMNQFKVEIINDPEAVCDPQGRYVFINIQAGNKTSIKQTGERCYIFSINNCEILDVTERYLLDVLEELNK